MSIQSINIIIVIVNKMYTQNVTGHQRRTDKTRIISSGKMVDQWIAFEHIKTTDIQVLLFFIDGILNGERIQVERSVEVQRWRQLM